MIERYKNDDAFNALEDVLLVPLPIGETNVPGGFGGEVLRRFKIAQIRFSQHSGLAPAEVLMVGHLGQEQPWIPAYSLALTGLHRQQSRGWEDTPAMLQEALDTISQTRRLTQNPKLATAGIPGTGFSGLRGNADPEAIKHVLDAHTTRITVYQDSFAGDRAKVTENPLQSDKVQLS